MIENAKGLSISLVDFSHCLNVAFNAAGPDVAGDIVLGQLRALRTNSSHVVVCLDSKPYKRSTVYPEYKAKRKQDPELANIWERTLQRVRAEGFQTAAAPREEADDVMATLGREYVAALCTDVRFVTADKDISQMLGGFRRWFYPILGKRDEFEIRDVAWMLEHWGLKPGEKWSARDKAPQQGPNPDQIPMLLAIMGDASDHIPGVKGIGLVQALALIRTYKTLEAIAQAAADAVNMATVEGKKPAALWENWIKGMAEVPRWLALTTLNDKVELERPALSYLEHIEPRPVVEPTPPPSDDDEIPFADADSSEHGDSWEGPTAEELEAERLAMAASLPVGRGVTITHQGPVTVVESELVGEPQREPAERRAAMAAEADRVFPSSAHDPSKMIVGADPKAREILASAAAERSSGSTAAPTAPAPSAPSAPVGAAPAAAPSAAGSAPTPSAATPPPAAPANQSKTNLLAEVVPANRGPAKGDIVKVTPPNWSLATQPNTVNGMWWVAEQVISVQAYKAYGNAAGVFNAISLGRELGLGYATSLDAFHLYNNKPLLKAVTYKALAEQHPDCEWIVITSADDTQATIETLHRKMGRLSYTYTAERARKAGYFTGGNRENWNNKTQEMLEARATTKSIRRWYAGVIVGFRSLEEEQDGD